MEFKNIKCPVCDKEFKDGDDIVVCPECGAPHHRECYEAENKCFFEDKHSEGFEFGKDNSDEGEQPDVKVCPNCGNENESTSFYCNKCGYPIGFDDKNNQQAQSNTQNQGGFGGPFRNTNPFAQAFDPMAGVNPEEDMGDGVTAGEISKHVRNNTPYFVKVFSNIKNLNKSRFNFSAFVFSECYFLYRKMYKLGAVFAALTIAFMTLEVYISLSPASTAFTNAISEVSRGTAVNTFNQFAVITEAMNRLDPVNKAWILIMSFCSIGRIIVRIIAGLTANRAYYTHCRRKISDIKKTSQEPQKDIETKGGVNTALAASILVTNFAIYYIPDIISMFTGG
jgi:hypothetical protein